MKTSNYTKGFVQVYNEIKSNNNDVVKRFYGGKDTLDYWFFMKRDGFIGDYILTDNDKFLVSEICNMLIEKLNLKIISKSVA